MKTLPASPSFRPAFRRSIDARNVLLRVSDVREHEIRRLNIIGANILAGCSLMLRLTALLDQKQQSKGKKGIHAHKKTGPLYM